MASKETRTDVANRTWRPVGSWGTVIAFFALITTVIVLGFLEKPARDVLTALGIVATTYGAQFKFRKDEKVERMKVQAEMGEIDATQITA